MEWKKVLMSRRLLSWIIGLLVIQTVTYWLDCRQKDIQWEELHSESYSEYLKEEQRQYYDHYGERIQSIVEQADSMEEISIFAQEDSFSQRNAQLTKKDFEPLERITLVDVTGRTVTDFFSFRIGNVCVLLCALAISFKLSEITSSGVRNITFTTTYGKLRLALKKRRALFLWAFILNFVFQISLFLEGEILFHENPITLLTCPVQSFLCFADFTWKLNMVQALIIYMLYRTFIIYVVMILTWSLCLLCNHIVLAVGIWSAFFTVEYCLYTYIAENHVLHLFKICNIWYWIIENSYFLKYKNLNIMGYAVGRNAVIIIALSAADVIGSAVGIYIWCTRYPHSSKQCFWHKAVNRIKTGIERIRGGILETLSLAGMETYKVLIGQKGLIAILLLVGLLFYRADFTQIQRSTQQKLYYEFIDNYIGVPCENSYKEIEELTNKLAKIDEIYEQKMSEDTIEGNSGIELGLWYESFEEERAFLQQIKEQTKSIETITAETGTAIWYVNQQSYNHLLRDDDLILNFGLLVVMLWICVGIYLREKQNGIVPIINCCQKKHTLYRIKCCVVVTIFSSVYLFILLFELVTIAVVYGIEGICAPVQSILTLSDISFQCTIWQYFLARYSGKYLLYVLMCLVACKVIQYVVCKRTQ